jgi:hypothetical protein
LFYFYAIGRHHEFFDLVSLSSHVELRTDPPSLNTQDKKDLNNRFLMKRCQDLWEYREEIYSLNTKKIIKDDPY